MLLYHVAGAILLFRYVFRDPKVDVRMLAFGAVLPNLIDKPLGTIMAPDYFAADRLYGHTLVFSTVIMVVALLTTRRGRRRRAIMAVAVGSMLHLVLDGMWTSAQTFFWPLFGLTFEPGRVDYWSDISAILDMPTILQELAGLAYLFYLYRVLELSDDRYRRELFVSGRLPG